MCTGESLLFARGYRRLQRPVRGVQRESAASKMRHLNGSADDTEDMANIGRALMARLPKDYHWSDCPTEIVTDLQNEIHDLKRAAGT